MKKEEVIRIIEETIQMREQAEDCLFREGLIQQAESYGKQKEDLEYCLKLVKKIE